MWPLTGGQNALMLFGPVGGALAGLSAEETAKETVGKYNLQDPAIRVKTNFVSYLQQVFGMNNITSHSEQFVDDDLDDLQKQFSNTTILDFETVKWGIFEKPFEGWHFVALSIRSRVVKLPEKKIIWQGLCEVEDQEPERVPHWDEFVKNEGVILKEKLGKLSEECAAKLFERFEGKGAVQS